MGYNTRWGIFTCIAVFLSITIGLALSLVVSQEACQRDGGTYVNKPSPLLPSYQCVIIVSK